MTKMTIGIGSIMWDRISSQCGSIFCACYWLRPLPLWFLSFLLAGPLPISFFIFASIFLAEKIKAQSGLYCGLYSLKQNLPSKILFRMSQQIVLCSQHKYKILITDGRILNQLKLCQWTKLNNLFLIFLAKDNLLTLFNIFSQKFSSFFWKTKKIKGDTCQ